MPSPGTGAVWGAQPQCCHTQGAVGCPALVLAVQGGVQGVSSPGAAHTEPSMFPPRLHPPHRADGPSGEERCGHHLPHQGGLHGVLRPQTGDPGEPCVLLPPRAGQPPRCPAQAWHHPHQKAAGGDHLRLRPCWPFLVTSPGTTGPARLPGLLWLFFSQLLAQPGLPTSRDWGWDYPKISPVFSRSPSPLSPWSGGAAGGCLGASSSLLLGRGWILGCPGNCLHLILWVFWGFFVAEAPGCRNKPAAALPASPPHPLPSLGAIAWLLGATSHGDRSQQCPKGAL